MIIESTSNPLVKQVKKLKDKKYRKETGLYVIEGVNLALEFLAHTPHLAKYVITTPERETCIPDGIQVTVVSEKVFEAMGETKSPQGIMVVGKMEEPRLDTDKSSLIVYLDNVKDPGNVGTIIRTSDAFGADAVVLSPNSADIYNSKTVRSTMGSMFHIPVLYENDYLEKIKALKNSGFNIITGSLDTKNEPKNIDFKTAKNVICLGNEAHGVSDELVSTGVTKVKIPMSGKAESLNVAIAGAVLLYECVRQRGNS